MHFEESIDTMNPDDKNLLGYTEAEYETFSSFAWRYLIMFSLLYMSIYCCRLNLSNASALMIEQLGFTKADIGVLTSVLFWTYGLGQLVNGRLCELLGTHRFVILAVLFSCGANLVMGTVSSFKAMMIIWALNGFFQSMAWTPGMSMLTKWWPKSRRGFATGFAHAFSGFGQACATVSVALAFNILPDKGWRSAFLLPPLLPMVMLLLYMVIAKPYPSAAGLGDYKEEEESAGTADVKSADDAKTACHEKASNTMSVASPSTDDGASAYENDGLHRTATWQLSKAATEKIGQLSGTQTEESGQLSKTRNAIYPYIYLLSNRKYLAWCFIAFLSGLARYGLTTWVPLYFVEEFGIDITAGLLQSLALPAGMGIGTLIVPWLTDKYCPDDRLPAVVISAIGGAASIAVFTKADPCTDSGLLIIELMLFAAGFCIYAVNGTAGTYATDIGDRQYSGTSTGIVNFSAYMGAAIQSAVYGALAESLGWNMVFVSMPLFCGLISLLGVLNKNK